MHDVKVKNCIIIGGYEDCVDIVRGGRILFEDCTFISNNTKHHFTIKCQVENVKIVKLTLEHLDIVHQFVVEEFAPDEPIFSRFGILQGTNFLSKMFNEEYKKELVIDPIESGHSFGAFDEKENLIGIKLGKIITKENMKR